MERIWKFYKYNFTDEVERLLRDYKQNQELLRRLGNRYYQVVYPIQVRHSKLTHVNQIGREGVKLKNMVIDQTFLLLKIPFF